MIQNWTADGYYCGPIPRNGFKPSVYMKALSFQTYSAQYPLQGPPGVSYLIATNGPTYVNYLLHRNPSGLLIGILSHFPFPRPPQKAGDVVVLVHPDYQKQGIGTALLKEAGQRWNVNLANQPMTVEGVALVKSLCLIKRRKLHSPVLQE